MKCYEVKSGIHKVEVVEYEIKKHSSANPPVWLLFNSEDEYVKSIEFYGEEGEDMFLTPEAAIDSCIETRKALVKTNLNIITKLENLRKEITNENHND